jgi:hypothetical protein
VFARSIPAAVAVLVLALAVAVPAGAATPEVVVYVCGKDLCRAQPDGRGVVRLTRDGKARGGYSRPAISGKGRRLAYRIGDPGRVYTAKVGARGLGSVKRIGPAPGGPSDATQFDVAISRDGKLVAWTETRVNVVFGGFDYRRYMARVDGREPRQVAASGGRPFVAFFDNTRIMREGFSDAFAGRPDASTVDQGLCLPDPESEQNGTCGDTGPQVAFAPDGRHLRHPAAAPNRRTVVATAYAGGEGIDNAVDHAGSLVLFDVATALPLRTLTPGPGDAYASFSPDGKSVVFERGSWVYRVPVAGGKAKRVLRGRQPAWGR